MMRRKRKRRSRVTLSKRSGVNACTTDRREQLLGNS